MSDMPKSPQKLQAPRLTETFERLKATSQISSEEWYDLIQMHWFEYQEFKLGRSFISEQHLDRIAQYFHVSVKELLQGKIDFKALRMSFVNKSQSLPEIYSKGAHGRSRTTINSFDFLEDKYNWRLRLDALQKFGVCESSLMDPFAPISMQLITDLCAYLCQRQFQNSDFKAMGAFGFEANQKTLIGKLLSETRSPQELYECFFQDLLQLFESNCSYKIVSMVGDFLAFEVLSDPHVATEFNVRHLGNSQVCELKGGMISSLTQHLDMPQATITETACVHRGDSVCRFEMNFGNPKPSFSTPPSGSHHGNLH
jgi:hypothetical protein